MKLAPTQPTVAFGFQGRNVRTVHIHGLPWFAAKDVCEILGILNSRDALNRLRAEEKGVGNADTLGGSQQLALVNESGLYALIFRSRKPAAQDFRYWVTNEVLPALRKTGFYALGQEALEDKAHWEMGRCRARLGLLRELTDLERDPKPGLEYLTVAEFVRRAGLRLEPRVEVLRFARAVQVACHRAGEHPVKQYRRRNRIPATLWPAAILTGCAAQLPPPPQCELPLCEAAQALQPQMEGTR